MKYSKSARAKVLEAGVISPEMGDDANAIAKLIHSLIDEINELRRVHHEALKNSIFVGATAEEIKQFDDRRERIEELKQKLSKLLGSSET